MFNFNPYKINEVNAAKFYQLPKELFENPKYNNGLNSDAKLLYSILLDRMELSRENNWVNEQDEIYLIFSRETLAEMMQITRQTVSKAFNQLVACNLIKEKRQGLTKPNLIFIGKIDYSSHPNNLMLKNLTSGGSKVEHQKVKNINANDTDISDTENIYRQKNIRTFPRKKNHLRSDHNLDTKSLYEI